MSSRNRRMTLSSVPKRPSIDPSQANSTQKGKRPARHNPVSRGRRQSMIPRIERENIYRDNVSRENGSPDSLKSNATRRSRASAMYSQKSMKDDRPINERAFKQRCIEVILNFTKKRNCSYSISAATLSRPSTKNFMDTTIFIFRQVDPSFQRGSEMRFEDEAAMAFKCMGYPFTISKTSLGLAGSGQAWPKLLAALAWLAQQIECKQANSPTSALHSDEPFQTLEQLVVITDAAFFEYLHGAFKAFMVKNQEGLEFFEYEIAERFRKDDARINAKIEEVDDINTKILYETQEYEEALKLLPAELETRENNIASLEEFDLIATQMMEFKAEEAQKVEASRRELAETNANLERMKTHVQELEQSIKDQEFSQDDVRKMESELRALQESMDIAESSQASQQQLLSKYERDMLDLSPQLDVLVGSYNESIKSLSSETGIDFSDIKVDVKKEMLSHGIDSFLGVKLDTEATQKIASATAEHKRLWEEVEANYQDMLDHKSRREGALAEFTAQLKIIQDKTEKCDAATEAANLAHEAKVAARRHEIELMESKTKSLCDPAEMEKQLAGSGRLCAELEARFAEITCRQKKELQSKVASIEEACQLMEEHDVYLEQTVAEAKAYWDDNVAEMENWEFK